MGNKPLHSHYARTGVHGRNDLFMNRTSSQACEEETPALLGSPKHSNVKQTEIVDPGVREGRRLVCELFTGSSAMMG